MLMGFFYLPGENCTLLTIIYIRRKHTLQMTNSNEARFYDVAYCTKPFLFHVAMLMDARHMRKSDMYLKELL